MWLCLVMVYGFFGSGQLAKAGTGVEPGGFSGKCNLYIMQHLIQVLK